jgi:hypothetical protein
MTIKDILEKVVKIKRELSTLENELKKMTQETILPDIPEDNSGKKINHFLTYFKKINPSYERLFANKTQRQALLRLYQKFGDAKLTKILETINNIYGQPYAPLITTPVQLENKLSALIAYMLSQKNKNNKIKIV